jgi:hypothetical protein
MKTMTKGMSWSVRERDLPGPGVGDSDHRGQAVIDCVFSSESHSNERSNIMGVRQRLNEGYLFGAVFCGAILGVSFNSWLLFCVTTGILLAQGVVGGGLRFSPFPATATCDADSPSEAETQTVRPTGGPFSYGYEPLRRRDAWRPFRRVADGTRFRITCPTRVWGKKPRLGRGVGVVPSRAGCQWLPEALWTAGSTINATERTRFAACVSIAITTRQNS